MAESAAEKKHPPSQHKLRQARRRGEVARSRELASGAGLLVATAMLAWLVPDSAARLLKLAGDCLAGGAGASRQPWLALALLARVVGLVGGAMLAGSVVANLAGSQVVWRMKLQLGGLNPVRGIKRMFSRERIVDLAVLLVKLPVLTLLGWLVLYRPVLALLIRGSELASLPALLACLLGRLLGVAVAVAGAGALFDLWLQRRRHRRRLRMSDQELRQEQKEQEGDPQLRQERRRRHRQLLQGVGMAALGRARVVVVNPTHVAVALAYQEDEDEAPWVVVSGWSERARAIREQAERMGIAVVHQVGLARQLVRLEWGEEIPESSYRAVAEVIRFVEGIEKGAAAEQSGANEYRHP